MIGQEHSLELCNVFHSGQVEPGTCTQRLMGSVKTGVILKDVSLEVHGGELLAVLGSKGSGKRALLEVISRRAQGPTRGQVLLDGAPMSLRLFHQRCAYVTHKCDLLPALSVEQTLTHASHLTIGSKVSHYVKKSRVKQVLADLALTQVANRGVASLAQSEYRRLMIGVQLVRDPVVLLLDEPTWDLDPLNTYLVVSILSNHARKYGRVVVLTMEKPRSDVFPFLDRVAYLCLGDVVYTGGTRLMLDYFRSIGFPCPELENPLMYYLCLSTVDRRSRDRFVESNHQIAALVDKFRAEGMPFRKSPPQGALLQTSEGDPKVPLSAFGRPGSARVAAALYTRCLSATFNFRLQGAMALMLRLFALPAYFLLLGLFFSGMQDYQRTFLSRNGLVFNSMAGVYIVAIYITTALFPAYRTRYYQEAQEGIYGGPLFLAAYLLVSLPFSLIATAAAAGVAIVTVPQWGVNTPIEWLQLSCALWACYLLAEQQTMALLMAIKSAFSAAVASLYLAVFALVLGSGSLRAYRGLSEWLLYASYATQPRYAGAILHHAAFGGVGLRALPFDQSHNCSATLPTGVESSAASASFVCRYTDGNAYLSERFGRDDGDLDADLFAAGDTNLAVAMAFPVGLLLVNCLLYLIPLPAFVKAKFRE